MLLIFYKGIEKEIYDQGRQKSCRKKTAGRLQSGSS